MLQKTNNNYYKNCYENINNLILLEKIVEYNYRTNNEIKPPKGLTKATMRYLLKELNKNEQLSNWEFRPLTTSQIHYASLDTHSMLAILGAIISDMKLKSQTQIEMKKQTLIKMKKQTQTQIEIKTYNNETKMNENMKPVTLHEEIQMIRKQQNNYQIELLLNNIINNELLSNQLCEIYQIYIK